MLQTFKEFFQEFVEPAANDDPKDLQHRLQLAAAALLVEVARADFHIDPQELETTQTLLKQRFDLNDEEIQALLEAAQNDVEAASSLHEFTSLITDHWDMPDRVKALEKMWRVALADGNLNKHERHLIRKIASLLYIPHSEYVGAKIRAES